MTDPWPPEAIESLRRYHALGWSAGKTGQAMGKSRNAIIGKLKRLGLHGRGAPTVYFAHTGGYKAKSRPAIIKPLPKPVIPSEAPESRGLGMMALSDSVCRYPINDGVPEWLFCGSTALKSSPYCAFHDSRTRVKATGKYK